MLIDRYREQYVAHGTTRRTRSSGPAPAGCSSPTPPSRRSRSTGRSTRGCRRQDLRTRDDPAAVGKVTRFADHRGGRRAAGPALVGYPRAGRGEDPRLPRELPARPAVGLDQPGAALRAAAGGARPGSPRRSSRWCAARCRPPRCGGRRMLVVRKASRPPKDDPRKDHAHSRLARRPRRRHPPRQAAQAHGRSVGHRARQDRVLQPGRVGQRSVRPPRWCSPPSCDGSLTDGGTMVEASSGNTGIGLGTGGRGPRSPGSSSCCRTRSAIEKVDILRAYGAEVVETPANVPREHPRHFNNLARGASRRRPAAGSPTSTTTRPTRPIHCETTGPEIWAATEGRVTHLVASIGTGGTISGTGRYLRSGAGVEVVGADPATSRYPAATAARTSWRRRALPASRDRRARYGRCPSEQDVVDRIEAIERPRLDPDHARPGPRRRACSSARRRRLVVAAALRVRPGPGPSTPWWRSCPTPGGAYLSKYPRRTGCGAWASSTTTGPGC